MKRETGSIIQMKLVAILIILFTVLVTSAPVAVMIGSDSPISTENNVVLEERYPPCKPPDEDCVVGCPPCIAILRV